MKIVQQPPFTIQIETTEGCNLGCNFCGLRGMRERGTTPLYFMTLETAENISLEIKRVSWKSKIVFGMHGEPTLNPEFLKIVKIFRKNLPDSMLHLITNGHGIVKSEMGIENYVSKLLEFGINDVILDNYSPNGDWYKIVELFDEESITHLKRGIPFFSNKKEFRILLVPPINFDNENFSTRNLANHCGAAFPLNKDYNNKRCTMPFRELSFRYDGNVSLCCDDFRGEYPISSIYELPIDKIWNHERFQAARVMLYNYDRNFRPCDGCTNVSMRVGLLPDSSGKETLPEITKEIRKIAESVAKENAPLATIVKRKWEK